MLKVALDVEGTIDAAPAVFASWLNAMKGSCETYVVTGMGGQGDAANYAGVAAYLSALGVGPELYEGIAIISGDAKEKAQAKASWLFDHGTDIFIDNDKGNAQAAIEAGIPLVLVPWASREGDKDDGNRKARWTVEQKRARHAAEKGDEM